MQQAPSLPQTVQRLGQWYYRLARYDVLPKLRIQHLPVGRQFQEHNATQRRRTLSDERREKTFQIDMRMLYQRSLQRSNRLTTYI